MVQAGSFREDLLFRLTSFTIELPPLRERNGDIKEIALHHIAKTCERYKIGLKGVAPGFMETLSEYPWPGNVRELIHTMERAIAAARYEPTLFAKHLPDEIRIYLARTSLEKSRAKGSNGEEACLNDNSLKLKDYREAMDKQYLRDLIGRTGGNVKEACTLSGLSRSRLYELLKLHCISIPT